MFDPRNRETYPVDPWRLIETALPDDPARSESVFALGNGFVGLRGVREEDDPTPACFVNGFYETWPIKYPEDAYGLARVGQTIQPAPLPTQLCVTVDGHRIGHCHSGPDEGDERPLAQRRELDMATGVLTRETTWPAPSGQVLVRSRRLVSFTRRGLVASVIEVIPDRPGDVVVEHALTVPPRRPANCGLDPRLGTVLDQPAIEVTARTARADGGVLGVRTPQADRRLMCVVGRRLVADGVSIEPVVAVDEDGTRVTWTCPSARSVRLVVLASYALGDDEDALRVASSELGAATELGWDGLAGEQADWLREFWAVADVEVDVRRANDERARRPDDDGLALQQGIRWSIFQTIQASARADGCGVAAKGVTGAGYDGHYFWDMEMYVLPFLTYVRPEAARAALGFRLATLPQAEKWASELSLRGALFPWRTIDGREASAFFPAGTAQYHIDADIAHALAQYVAATGDASIMADGGDALAVETARMWASLGFWGEDGRFHLHYVTGPDEYSALVDDNVYTNVMARANLRFAADVALRAIGDGSSGPLGEVGGGHQPAQGSQTPSSTHDLGGHPAWAGVCGVASPNRLPPATVSIRGDEIAEWRRIADGMCVPFDAARGVHPQDANFLGRQPWSIESIPRENFPLLLHYHPLTIYRHQVLKQADVVLAQITCPGDFTPAQKRANFDFYDPLTTGDSTLSAVPQAIAAAEVGHLDLAREYLERAAFVDLADSHGNTDAGVHVAVAAGVWDVLVSGFGGLRDFAWGGGAESGISLNPQLPKGWSSLRFRLLVHGVTLTVRATADDVTLTADGPVELTVWGRPVTAGPEAPITVTPQVE